MGENPREASTKTYDRTSTTEKEKTMPAGEKPYNSLVFGQPLPQEHKETNRILQETSHLMRDPLIFGEPLPDERNKSSLYFDINRRSTPTKTQPTFGEPFPEAEFQNPPAQFGSQSFAQSRPLPFPEAAGTFRYSEQSDPRHSSSRTVAHSDKGESSDIRREQFPNSMGNNSSLPFPSNTRRPQSSGTKRDQGDDQARPSSSSSASSSSTGSSSDSRSPSPQPSKTKKSQKSKPMFEEKSKKTKKGKDIGEKN